MTQREIKFRAMRDDMNPSWVYGSLLYGGDIPRIQELPLFSLFTTCLKGTEGQFTGLQDKNGGDVYEGDIFCASWTGEEEPDVLIGEVVFDTDGTGQWMVDPHLPNEPAEPFVDVMKAGEIIGNIYENPELLK